MALQETWIRGRPSQGLRQINIRYDIEESQFGPIEELLQKSPYKQVNRVMREALLLGAKIMIQTASSGSIAEITSTPNKRGQGPAKAAPKVEEPKPAFSKAATSMFEQFGKVEK